MAESVRFELTRILRPCRFSRPVHSTALPNLRLTCIAHCRFWLRPLRLTIQVPAVLSKSFPHPRLASPPSLRSPRSERGTNPRPAGEGGAQRRVREVFDFSFTLNRDENFVMPDLIRHPVTWL